MDFGVPGPSAECLSEVPEDNTTATPEGDERHVGHDRRNESATDCPWCNELREPVTPYILVDGDSYENASSNWFVAVDCVGG